MLMIKLFLSKYKQLISVCTLSFLIVLLLVCVDLFLYINFSTNNSDLGFADFDGPSYSTTLFTNSRSNYCIYVYDDTSISTYSTVSVSSYSGLVSSLSSLFDISLTFSGSTSNLNFTFTSNSDYSIVYSYPYANLFEVSGSSYSNVSTALCNTIDLLSVEMGDYWWYVSSNTYYDTYLNLFISSATDSTYSLLGWDMCSLSGNSYTTSSSYSLSNTFCVIGVVNTASASSSVTYSTALDHMNSTATLINDNEESVLYNNGNGWNVTLTTYTALEWDDNYFYGTFALFNNDFDSYIFSTINTDWIYLGGEYQGTSSHITSVICEFAFYDSGGSKFGSVYVYPDACYTQGTNEYGYCVFLNNISVPIEDILAEIELGDDDYTVYFVGFSSVYNTSVASGHTYTVQTITYNTGLVWFYPGYDDYASDALYYYPQSSLDYYFELVFNGDEVILYFYLYEYPHNYTSDDLSLDDFIEKYQYSTLYFDFAYVVSVTDDVTGSASTNTYTTTFTLNPTSTVIMPFWTGYTTVATSSSYARIAITLDSSDTIQVSDNEYTDLGSFFTLAEYSYDGIGTGSNNQVLRFGEVVSIDSSLTYDGDASDFASAAGSLFAVVISCLTVSNFGYFTLFSLVGFVVILVLAFWILKRIGGH